MISISKYKYKKILLFEYIYQNTLQDWLLYFLKTNKTNKKTGLWLTLSY